MQMVKLSVLGRHHISLESNIFVAWPDNATFQLYFSVHRLDLLLFSRHSQLQ